MSMLSLMVRDGYGIAPGMPIPWIRDAVLDGTVRDRYGIAPGMPMAQTRLVVNDCIPLLWGGWARRAAGREFQSLILQCGSERFNASGAAGRFYSSPRAQSSGQALTSRTVSVAWDVLPTTCRL